MNSRIAKIFSERVIYTKMQRPNVFIPDFSDHNQLYQLSDTLNDVDAFYKGYDVDKYGVEQIPLPSPNVSESQMFDNVVSKELDENELAAIARMEEDNVKKEKEKNDKSD